MAGGNDVENIAASSPAAAHGRYAGQRDVDQAAMKCRYLSRMTMTAPAFGDDDYINQRNQAKSAPIR